MENFGTVSDASAGTGGSFGTSVAKCGIWSGTRANGLKRMSTYLFSPQASRVKCLRGEAAKPWYFMVFYSLRSPPHQKFHCGSKVRFLRI